MARVNAPVGGRDRRARPQSGCRHGCTLVMPLNYGVSERARLPALQSWRIPDALGVDMR
jgi:hypothetical protein